MPCYFHFSGQNIIKCITFCSKTQKIVINQYFLKYLRQSDCYLFRFSTSQIWTYYSNIIQILSGVSKDGENPLLKLLIRDSYLSALVSLGTVQHCRLFLSLLGEINIQNKHFNSLIYHKTSNQRSDRWNGQRNKFEAVDLFMKLMQYCQYYCSNNLIWP